MSLGGSCVNAAGLGAMRRCGSTRTEGGSAVSFLARAYADLRRSRQQPLTELEKQNV